MATDEMRSSVLEDQNFIVEFEHQGRPRNPWELKVTHKATGRVLYLSSRGKKIRLTGVPGDQLVMIMAVGENGGDTPAIDMEIKKF